PLQLYEYVALCIGARREGDACWVIGSVSPLTCPGRRAALIHRAQYRPAPRPSDREAAHKSMSAADEMGFDIDKVRALASRRGSSAHPFVARGQEPSPVRSVVVGLRQT